MKGIIKGQNSKKGISLIVLVITIIVIIILAVAVILSINNNNPINNAKKAVNDWNDATVKEQINLLMLDYQLSGKSMGDFLREKAASGDIGLEESDSSYIIELGDKKAGINKENNKVIGITSKDIFDEVKKMKEEFEASKSSITKNLIKDEAEIKTYISSYSGEKYTFYITQGNNLLYMESDVMTEEKRMACEMQDIYLLGDINRNYELDDEDYTIIISSASGKLTNLQRILADIDGNTYVTLTDQNDLAKILRNKFTPYIEKVKAEFDANIAKEGSNRVNITTTDTSVLRKYMPSHTDSKFDFGILKGELICLPFKNTGQIKGGICWSNGIYMLGDFDGNCKIDREDVYYLEDYLAGVYTPTEEDNPANIVGDYNMDGTVDNKDLELLRADVAKN